MKHPMKVGYGCDTMSRVITNELDAAMFIAQSLFLSIICIHGQ